MLCLFFSLLEKKGVNVFRRFTNDVKKAKGPMRVMFGGVLNASQSK
jgi:hypothetical protein